MGSIRILLFAILCFQIVSTCDDITASMVVSFAKNEQRPTSVVLQGLCCNLTQQMKLYRTLTTAGFFVTTSIQENNDLRRHELLVMADLNCPNADRFLVEAIMKKLMKSPLRWLILRNARNQPRHLDPGYRELVNHNLLPNSDVVIAERLEQGRFEFFEVYRPSSLASSVETMRGWWCDGEFHDTRAHRELFKRRRDLMKSPLIMANVILDSDDTKVHLLKEDRLKLHQDAHSKIVWNIVRMAMDMLNATSRYNFLYSMGYKAPDGNWSGMISDLLHGRADLGTSCILTNERSKVVDFVAMVVPGHFSFILRQPPLSHVSNIYTLPFSVGVWLSILVCVFASGMTLWIIFKWAASRKNVPRRMSGGLKDVFLLTMSAVFQQGSHLELRNTSGRVTTVIMFTALMALYSAYSANIVVLLQAPSSAISNLQDLYNSKITLASSDFEYSKHLFRREIEPLRRAIYEKKIAPRGGKHNYYPLEEGVKRIRQGLFAFHAIAEPVYRRIEETFLETEKCDLVEVDYANDFDPWLPIQKDSPYGELFKVVFKQIRESGLQDVVHKRYHTPKPKCSGRISAFTSVSLKEFYPAILFMLYGFGLAVIVLILEIFVYHRVNVFCFLTNRL